jgi:fluoroquinolone resistance protein
MSIISHDNESFQNKTFSPDDINNNEFSNCTFHTCDFSNGIFSSGIFIDCIFESSNLTMAKLFICQLNNNTFKNSKVLGVNFSDCDDVPFSVRFEGCILDYCSFSKKKMPKTSFVSCSMKGADFSEADLSKSVFSNTDLMNAVFHRTILKEANFATASNYIIDPETNTIKKAVFSVHGLSGLLNTYDIIIE